MTVTNVEKNKDNLTMTITAEFDAPVERVWQLWENPRLLERWWGPPTYPATFTEFQLVLQATRPTVHALKALGVRLRNVE